jgi:outer membrane protein OmpA-like peptidoglycan-associated protein
LKNILTKHFDKAKKARIFGISITKSYNNKLNFQFLIMKNPIPFLSVALAFVIFGSTFIRNMTCPCNVAAVLPILPTIAAAAIPVAETNKPTVTKEISLNFKFNANKVVSKKDVSVIEDYLKTHASSTILISGHTDSRGTDAYNQKLSESRANYVKKMLVKKGINANQITTEGKGESVPLSTNDTAEGRKKNRRVVIQIFG